MSPGTVLENAILHAGAGILPDFLKLRGQFYYTKIRGWADQELNEVKNIAEPGQIAIDIGANNGIWSYGLSKLFSKVEAFEPNPLFTKKLSRSYIKGITIHEVALSSTCGTAILSIPISKGKQITGWATLQNLEREHDEINVSKHTLDEYMFKNVGFIKIDVEGHELEVLKGATETLLREKPAMVIEIEQRHLDIPLTMVFDFIFNLGYEAYFFYQGKLHPFAEFSYEIHQEQYLLSGSRDDYVNNFIFKYRGNNYRETSTG